MRALFVALLVACSSGSSARKGASDPPGPKSPPPAAVLAVLDTDGDGVPDKQDNCPDLPGPSQHQGCPWCDTMVDWVICVYENGKPDPHCPKGTAEDPDADGLVGDKDKCPSVPEDKDGFEDDDGCPEIDNDQDCVFDEQDKCPLEPGPLSTAGCPARR